MKRVSSLVLISCFLFTCAGVRAVYADSTSGEVAKNVWIRAYVGYDIAFLSDITTGLDAFGAYAKSQGFTTTSNDNTGSVAEGGELGLQFDPEDALSVGFENISATTLSNNGTSSGGSYTYSYAPSLMDVTLTYTRTIVKSSNAKTNLFIGGGYYFASGVYALGITGSGIALGGTYNGNTLGGLLGASEEISLGDTFSLLISAKGRFAQINDMTSTNMTGNGIPSGTYDLVITNAASPGYNILYVQPRSAPFTGTNTRDAVQDESSIQGDITLSAHF